ncbi:hypothetical protein TWF102_005729 [Orbilia oligospora]|uniref:Fe2OG dioxygenase domain-containing protein n=2 Tax=Orbilia oligospora TaxID=2813651 RepID=A0A7C8NAT1_ORBOL|nr:hypothetical protein TWF102_005729 [Orbilia oligospora]KAF3114662.1 hypothetical protein TWF103_001115 [Orbilia oligospora]KAF3114941.1 hypothetical protein TWF706_007085 [Orbilia oligospora]KAF3146519.1 hypothetical protein TWF594_003306 [Orbilia oligospora]
MQRSFGISIQQLLTLSSKSSTYQRIFTFRPSKSNMVVSSSRLPNGTVIDIAQIDKINLAKLEFGNSKEIEKLRSAAESHGVFYLDFHGSEMGNLLFQQLGEIYYLSQQYFDQDEASKTKDIRSDQKSSQDRGYKSCETDQTFEMSYDELVKGDLCLPQNLQPSRHTLKYFSEICHNAALTMLRSLSTSLSPDEPFEKYHQKSKQNDSGLKLVYEPCIPKRSEVLENKHTDSGTLTILFAEQLGLHVQMADGSWGYTDSIPGCAIVHVADSLQFMSGGKLRSPVHRVTQPVNGFMKRYFLSYFLRPEDSFKEKCRLRD